MAGRARPNANDTPMKRTLQMLGATLACAVAATFVQGSIRTLTLDQMMANVDNAVVGQIVDRHVFRADHPVDGTMYFTTITVDGTSLIDGQPLRVPVTYLGGWIDENEGTSTSVTPDPNTVALGKRVVAFYAQTDNMGYGVAANQLVASHGGVFQVVQRRAKLLTLGKGQGFAIDKNIEVGVLRSRTQKIASDLVSQGKQYK